MARPDLPNPARSAIRQALLDWRAAMDALDWADTPEAVERAVLALQSANLALRAARAFGRRTAS